MSHATYLIGDVFDRMKELEDGSVDLIVTSPPFLALRSYLPADHPDKSKEIGSEPTPAAFIDVMLALSAEWRRVLAPHGSIAVELGDTYSGPQPTVLGEFTDEWAAKYAKRSKVREQGLIGEHRRVGDGWPQAKSKALIPELYRIALAYGIHPLTGSESPAGQWRVRNVVRWCRPNPPVGALGDKWRPATSDIVVACVSAKRYWDDIATRKPHSREHFGNTTSDKSNRITGSRADDGKQYYSDKHPSGAPLLDYWELPPGGYQGSHYAVYPPALIEPLIKAMAPPRVCVECGEPSRRIVETTYDAHSPNTIERQNSEAWRTATKDGGPMAHGRASKISETTGWTDCGHDNYRPALILDPFAGSGTTLMVATGHGHNAIGIDIDERNADLARERIGELFLTVEEAA